MHIATNIKYLRKRVGLTQGELAQRIDKTQATIGDYEKGKSTPPVDILLQFCDIFSIDLNRLVNIDLVKESYTGPSPAPEPADLAERYELLRRMANLQDQRLAELEREIREHAPELARRLGLEKG